jgi:hypothetical protein
MLKVVDSNLLQSLELRAYFGSSKENKAVLTDYAAMEAYKGDALKSIYKSMEVLSEFPSQVVILKSTGVVSGLRGRLKGLQRRLIDHKQTSEFEHYCAMLARGKRGDRAVEKAIMKHSEVANGHMAIMLADVEDLPEVFGDMAAEFTAEELAVFRKGEPYTEKLFEKMVESTMMLAAILFAKHPNTKRPQLHELAYTYPFRFSLCGHLLFERWVAAGRPKIVKAEKLRNDMVDLSFASYATFFDGLLTADKKLKSIHSDATQILRVICREFAKEE